MLLKLYSHGGDIVQSSSRAVSIPPNHYDLVPLHELSAI